MSWFSSGSIAFFPSQVRWKVFASTTQSCIFLDEFPLLNSRHPFLDKGIRFECFIVLENSCPVLVGWLVMPACKAATKVVTRSLLATYDLRLLLNIGILYAENLRDCVFICTTI